MTAQVGLQELRMTIRLVGGSPERPAQGKVVGREGGAAVAGK